MILLGATLNLLLSVLHGVIGVKSKNVFSIWVSGFCAMSFLICLVKYIN